MQTQLNFEILPYVSPNYSGNHYHRIRSIIKQWMTREFKQQPIKLYVDMDRNRGNVTFAENTPWLQEVVKMTSEHPLGQLCFNWNQSLKNRHTDPRQQIPKPRICLPHINYPQRIAECHYNTFQDMNSLDELDFQQEAELSLLMSEISLLEANEALDELDSEIPEEPKSDDDDEDEDTNSVHSMVIELTDDEDEDDEIKVTEQKLTKQEEKEMNQMNIDQKLLLAWLMN